MAAWSPFFLSRIIVLGLLAFSPWIQGSANWREQFWLTLGTMAAVLFLFFDVLDRMLRKAPQETLRVPAAGVVVFLVACFAWFQTLPLFPLNANGGLSPNSVQIQRWFLGYPNPEIAKMLQVDDAETGIASASSYPEHRLAISIEPLHTLASVPAVVMVGVMIWIGAVGFKEQKWQLALMILMTVLGIVVGLLGMLDILSWNREAVQLIPGGSTFGVFVSRNCAGGFLTICFAASLGLSTWAFSRPRQVEQRYAYGGESPALRIIRVFEDGLAQLTTSQIACIIANGLLVGFVIASNSRGAIISIVAAGLVVLLLGSFNIRGAGRWVFAMLIVLICLVFAIGFALDTKVSHRFAELASSKTLEHEYAEGRLYIWSIALKTFAWFWATGSGLGTFHFAHHPFQSPQAHVWYYHAESLYLQALVDLGWVGIALILAMGWFAYQTLKRVGAPLPKSRTRAKELRLEFEPIYVMGLALVVSQFLHACADFTLIVPSLFLPAGLMFGALLGSGRERRRKDAEFAASSLDLVVEDYSAKPGRTSRPASRSASRLVFAEDGESASPEAGSHSRGKMKSSTSGSVHTDPSFAWFGLTVLGLSLFLMYSGLAAMDALRLVKKMERWTTENGKRTLPVASLSAYLAGIWESPIMPFGRIGIAEVPDALRMMGGSLLSEHRLAKLEKLRENPKLNVESTELFSKPLITRIEMAEKARRLEESGTSRVFDETEVRLLMGDEKQWMRWSKAVQFFERAQLSSPLDWRLAWFRVLCDHRIDVRRWNGWMERSQLLAQNDPGVLFDLGLLVRDACLDKSKSEQVWKKMFAIGYEATPTIAAIVSVDTPDELVPLNLFPRHPDFLFLIQNAPFDAKRFPVTNERIWRAIEELATEMPPINPERSKWLAAVAARFGNVADELEHLAQAVRQNPSSRELRLQWVNRLAESGELTAALEQAEYCLSLAPEDPRSDAVVKNLRERVRLSEELPAIPR